MSSLSASAENLTTQNETQVCLHILWYISNANKLTIFIAYSLGLLVFFGIRAIIVDYILVHLASYEIVFSAVLCCAVSHWYVLCVCNFCLVFMVLFFIYILVRLSKTMSSDALVYALSGYAFVSFHTLCLQFLLA